MLSAVTASLWKLYTGRYEPLSRKHQKDAISTQVLYHCDAEQFRGRCFSKACVGCRDEGLTMWTVRRELCVCFMWECDATHYTCSLQEERERRKDIVWDISRWYSEGEEREELQTPPGEGVLAAYRQFINNKAGGKQTEGCTSDKDVSSKGYSSTALEEKGRETALSISLKRPSHRSK